LISALGPGSPEIAGHSPMRDSVPMDADEALRTERDAVREAVRARMRARGVSTLELAEIAGVSYNTINMFLTGIRGWPRARSRAKIEIALGWQPGEMEKIARNVSNGAQIDYRRQQVDTESVVSVHRDTNPHVVLDFPPGALDGLSAAEVREVRAAAELAALQRMREILAARSGGTDGRERRS
jgi:DNA-binding CsgD family transcriptional regulator